MSAGCEPGRDEPTVNVRAVEFVSKRVRNYRYSPVGGFIANQVWLR